MSLTVTGVPEKISRADYLRLVESVGFDVNELRELVFAHNCVTAVIIARHVNGMAYPVNPTGEVAEHRIVIPVED